MPSADAKGFEERHDQIAITIQRAYSRPEVLRDVIDALALAGYTLHVTKQVRHLPPAPGLLVVLDGWAGDQPIRALANLRKLLPRTPALAMVTGRHDTEAELLAAGFKDCIVWPVTAVQLLTRVQRGLLANAAGQQASIALDPVHMTMECNAVRLTLTRGELRLMQELLKSRDQWSTGRQLHDGMAGSKRVGLKPVASHIHAIRRKLQHEAWRLRSHRVLGYFFDTSRAEPNTTVVDAGSDDSASKKE